MNTGTTLLALAVSTKLLAVTKDMNVCQKAVILEYLISDLCEALNVDYLEIRLHPGKWRVSCCDANDDYFSADGASLTECISQLQSGTERETTSE